MDEKSRMFGIKMDEKSRMLAVPNTKNLAKFIHSLREERTIRKSFEDEPRLNRNILILHITGLVEKLDETYYTHKFRLIRSARVILNLLTEQDLTLENLYEKMGGFCKEAINKCVAQLQLFDVIKFADGILSLNQINKKEIVMKKSNPIFNILIESIKSGFKTSKEMAILTGKSRNNILNYLQKMENEKMIKKVCSHPKSRNTRYELFETAVEIPQIEKKSRIHNSTKGLKEKILDSINRGKHYTNDIRSNTKTAQNTTWRFLSNMASEGLLKTTKEGKRIRYEISGKDIQIPTLLRERILKVLSMNPDGVSTLKEIKDNFPEESIQNIFEEINSLMLDLKLYRVEGAGSIYKYTVFKPSQTEVKPQMTPIPKEIENKQLTPAEIMFSNNEFKNMVNQFIINQTDKIVEEKSEKIGCEKAINALINFGLTKEAAEKAILKI